MISNRYKFIGILMTVVILIETGITIFYSYFPVENPTTLQIGTITRAVNIPGMDNDLLIFGDSSARRALEPSVLFEFTGLKCINLSTPSNTTMAGNYRLLRDYLNHNDPPKYILLMNVHDMWQMNLSNERYMVIQVLALMNLKH